MSIPFQPEKTKVALLGNWYIVLGNTVGLI